MREGKSVPIAKEAMRAIQQSPWFRRFGETYYAHTQSEATMLAVRQPDGTGRVYLFDCEGVS